MKLKASKVQNKLISERDKVIKKLAEIATGARKPDFAGQDKYIKLFLQVAGELVDRKEIGIRIELPEEIVSKLAETLQHINEAKE